MDQSIAVRKIDADVEKRKQNQELILELVRNPMLTTIGGCVLVELLQHVSIGKTAAQPGGFNWSSFSEFGWHASKPSKDIALLSEPLGSAIEVGLIINLAGGLQTIIDNVSKLGQTVGLLGLTKGLVK